MSSLTGDVPVIDFAQCGLEVDDPLDDKQVLDVGEQIYDAMRSSGFAYLRNTGILLQDIAKVNSVADEFFDAPIEQKKKYAVSGGFSGYVGVGAENVDSLNSKDHKEGFMVACRSLSQPEFQWPNEISENFECFLREFMEKCKKLVLRILKTLAVGMKLKDTNHFINCHKNLHEEGNVSSLRFNNYPPIPKGECSGRIRLGRHSDYGFITLLFQDNIGGLQAETRNGEFIDVVPIEGTVVINIGDLLESWSRNRLRSTKHRVVDTNDPEKQKLTRRSIAYFVIPDDHILVDEELVFEGDDDVPKKAENPGMTAGEYLHLKFLKTFNS